MPSEDHQFLLKKGIEYFVSTMNKTEDVIYTFGDIRPDCINKMKDGKLVFIESLTNINQIQMKIGLYINHCDLLVLIVPFKPDYAFWNISPKVKILIVRDDKVMTTEEYIKEKKEMEANKESTKVNWY